MSRTGENIYKRKDGRWEGRYIKGHNGVRSCYGYTYGRTYKEVKNKLIRAKAEWDSRQIQISGKKSDDVFTDVAAKWLESRESFLKDSTLAKYKNLLRSYILPSIGSCRISEITNDKIYLLSSSLLKTGGMNEEGLSQKTVADSLSLLRCILKFALGKNMYVNFTAFICPLKPEYKQLRILSVQEQHDLCRYLKQNKSLSNLGILMCLFTGIRIGELCALKWEDISFTEKTLFIHQTMQRLPDADYGTNKTRIHITSPKSSSSIRIVPLPDILMEEVVPMRQYKDAFFLSGHSTRYVEPRTMQNRFKNVLKCCGLRDANFHTLRHTFATRCIEVGFDIKSLSEILGHANVNITLNRYVHPTLDLKRENMSKLSELIAVR